MARIIEEREVVQEPIYIHHHGNNGVLIALVIVIGLILLAILFGIRGGGFLPSRSGPQISVPKQIDINVNHK